jgi:S-adenosylmethionine synthetase
MEVVRQVRNRLRERLLRSRDVVGCGRQRRKAVPRGAVSDARLSELVNRCFDLRPAAIIERLDLRRPIYRQTAAYGHFGRTDIDLPWEKENRAEALKAAIG